MAFDGVNTFLMRDGLKFGRRARHSSSTVWGANRIATRDQMDKTTGKLKARAMRKLKPIRFVPNRRWLQELQRGGA